MKGKLTASLFAIFVVATSFHAHNACATPVLWTLAQVTFDDGGKANGTFTFDADTLQYSSVFVTVQGGNFPAVDFNNLFFGYRFVAAGTADFVTFDGQSLDSRFLSLRYSSPLTNSGGTVALASGSEARRSGFPGFRNIVRGFVSTSPDSIPPPPDVPEPSSLMLLASGLAGLGMWGRRHWPGC
jgi:hypothetical protein